MKEKQNYNIRNERLKLMFYEFLAHARGLKESTIESRRQGIQYYERFSKHADFTKFSTQKAEKFKDYLQSQDLTLSSVKIILKSVKEFFSWLSHQKGFRSKISLNSIEYLNLSRSQNRIAQSQAAIEYPSLQEIKNAFAIIPPDSEKNRRNRAILAFLLLSGVRVNALISLPLKAFNPDTLELLQDPKLGVHTKFSKKIEGFLFRFDEELVNEVKQWVTFLREEKNFKDTDPLFPRLRLGHKNNSKIFVPIEVVPVFLKSTTTIYNICKESFRNAKEKEYSAHKFRHSSINIAVGSCTNGKEFKAVSQNFGHENVMTTISIYAQLSKKELRNTISNMNFGDKETTEEVVLKKFIDFIKGGKNNF